MSVKFTFGGVKRDLRIELRSALKFEDATGLGFLALTREIIDKTAPLRVVAEVLRVAFEENGTKLSFDEIMGLIEADEQGIFSAYTFAGNILTELCLRPEGALKGKKLQPPKGGGRNASH